MTTYAYIDGFNLYYRAVKGTSYKWLDLLKMCALVAPEYPVDKIKYFTARVSGRKSDPDQPNRQQIYLRALRTIPNLEIIYGRFLSRYTFMALSIPIHGLPNIVQVIKTDEKGSDVNLATDLLIDAYSKSYDVALVVTNDSDLASPIKHVRDRLGLTLGILNPDEKTQSTTLQKAASFVRPIREGVLKVSQFPDNLRDSKGVFHKPSMW